MSSVFIVKSTTDVWVRFFFFLLFSRCGWRWRWGGLRLGRCDGVWRGAVLVGVVGSRCSRSCRDRRLCRRTSSFCSTSWVISAGTTCDRRCRVRCASSSSISAPCTPFLCATLFIFSLMSSSWFCSDDLSLSASSGLIMVASNFASPLIWFSTAVRSTSSSASSLDPLFSSCGFTVFVGSWGFVLSTSAARALRFCSYSFLVSENTRSQSAFSN